MIYKYAEEITPSDSEDLSTKGTEAILVGGAGDLEVTLTGMEDGESVILKDLNAGEIYELDVKRVWNTDTTATDIVALY